MGFNTVAVLYNDHYDRFASSGDLGVRIAHAMRDYSSRDRYPSATNFGAGQVVSQAHADYTQIVAVGKNTGYPISEANDLDWMALEQMAECLKRHGYQVKKPGKKRRAA